MLFDTLGASLLGNMLVGRGIVRIVRAAYGANRKRMVRGGYGSKMDF